MTQPSQATNDDDSRRARPELAAQVELAARALLNISARASMELPNSVSITQLRGLAAVHEHGPCTLSSFADALMMSTSSASRLVDRLTAAGLLDRQPAPTSRREVRLQITPRGQRLLHQHTLARQALFADVLQDMPGRDVQALLRGLHAVQRQLDTRPTER